MIKRWCLRQLLWKAIITISCDECSVYNSIYSIDIIGDTSYINTVVYVMYVNTTYRIVSTMSRNAGRFAQQPAKAALFRTLLGNWKGITIATVPFGCKFLA